MAFHRDELEEWIVERFTPMIDRNEESSTSRARGLIQQGLPYERDPAITRHILHFLRSQVQHQSATSESTLLTPDAIFSTGGRPVLCRSGRGSRLLLLRGGGGRVSRSSIMMSPTGRLASERSATV